MSEMWLWVLGACAIAYLTKLSGYLVPRLVREVAGDPGKRPL